ncbi:MAG TPA: thioesterase family protein [Streptosporangiaceae bacterium]|nr:thioesterase family protein [Streptosporangiaceae bacterium]
MNRYFEHRHVVGLDELTPSGQVRLTRFLQWQSTCREDFLRRQATWLLTQIEEGIEVVVLECRCEYLSEIPEFDEIAIRMRLAELYETEIALAFDYVLLNSRYEQLVATGRHRLAFRQTNGTQTRPTAVPPALQDALEGIAAPSVTRIGSDWMAS